MELCVKANPGGAIWNLRGPLRTTRLAVLVTAGKHHRIVFYCYFTGVNMSLVPSHSIPYLVENVRT